MSDRLYSDDEVSEILRRATVPRPDARGQLVREDGMTLAQLEAIAREAGIEPERVAAAARELDTPSAAPRKVIGVPVSVARSVELPRRLTEAEWEHLVTRLRETFDASGKLETHGTLRQWSNGNLRVMLEPGIHGHRVRFTSLNQGMRFRLLAGTITGGVLLGGSFLAAILPNVDALSAIPASAIGGIIGLFVAASAVQSLKGWRSERRTQFDAIAAELERLAQREPNAPLQAPRKD